MTTAELINQNSSDVEYYTPPEIIEAARDTLEGIDLDPASCEHANKTVQAGRIFTCENDGLKLDWSARLWMNHPFGRREPACPPVDCPRKAKNPKHVCHAYDLHGNAAWVNKFIGAYRAGHVTAACNITFAATSEAWFQPLAKFPMCYLSPRTNYYLRDGTRKPGVTKGSVVTYLGSKVDRFAKAFEKFGEVKVACTALLQASP